MTDTTDQNMIRRADQPEAPAARRGGALRLLLTAVAIVGVLLAAAVVVYNNTRASRSQPIEIDLYPNAALISESKTAQSDERVLATTDSLDQVYAFYVQRLGELPEMTSGELAEDRSQGCRKVYAGGEKTEEVGQVSARCFIDNSSNDVTQFVRLTISRDAAETPTQIVYQRAWGN
jgi:Tfp pilus assembly protein PilE